MKFTNLFNSKNITILALILLTLISNSVAINRDVPKYCSKNLQVTSLDIARRTIPIEDDNHSDIIIFPANSTIPIYVNTIERGYTIFEIVWMFISLYIIICYLAIFKWYEEMQKAVKNQTEARFSHFLDISNKREDEINSDFIKEYEGKYVFISGITQCDNFAKDPLFRHKYNRDYLKIERKVEVKNPYNDKWMEISSKNNSDSFQCKLIKDCHLRVDFENPAGNDKMTFHFPRIISCIHTGEASLKNIKLTKEQLKKLQNSETIIMPYVVQELDYMNEFFIEENGQEGFNKIEFL